MPVVIVVAVIALAIMWIFKTDFGTALGWIAVGCFVLACFGFYAQAQEKERQRALEKSERDRLLASESIDRSYEASQIGRGFSEKAGHPIEENDKYAAQAAEVYKYYRDQGLNNDQAIQVTQETYQKAYGKAVQKALRGMVKKN